MFAGAQTRESSVEPQTGHAHGSIMSIRYSSVEMARYSWSSLVRSVAGRTSPSLIMLRRMNSGRCLTSSKILRDVFAEHADGEEVDGAEEEDQRKQTW